MDNDQQATSRYLEEHELESLAMAVTGALMLNDVDSVLARLSRTPVTIIPALMFRVSAAIGRASLNDPDLKDQIQEAIDLLHSTAYQTNLALAREGFLNWLAEVNQARQELGNDTQH